MATSNPVFANYQPPTYYFPDAPQGTATVKGMVGKTAGGLAMVTLVALASFLLLPQALLGPVTIATALLTFVAVVIVAKQQRVQVGHVAAYSVLEGVFLGAMTRFFEALYPGIALQAVFATLVVAALTLAFVRTTNFTATPKFRRVVTIATLSLAVVYLINLVLSLFHVSLGVVEVGPQAGMLSWLVSALAVGLATLNLVTDFSDAEALVAHGGAKTEEWRVAFGIMVTLVWLYVELLRVLSYFKE